MHPGGSEQSLPLVPITLSICLTPPRLPASPPVAEGLDGELSVEVTALTSSSDDDDLDSQLAAAASAADAERKTAAKGGFRLPKNFLKPSSRRATAEAELPEQAQQAQRGSTSSASAEGPASLRASREGEPPQGTPQREAPRPPTPGDAPQQAQQAEEGQQQAFDPVAALQDFYGGPTTPAPLLPSDGAGPGPGPGPPSPLPGGDGDGEAGGHPWLHESEPCPAAYLLLATQDYLRVYSTGEWLGCVAGLCGRRRRL